MKKTIGILIGLILSFSMVVNAEMFTDISSNHWGYDEIYWGVEKGIIKGYPDKTFKPSLQITESEFASVLVNFVKNTDKNNLKANEGQHWAQGIYDELARFQLPLKGYNNAVAKNTALTRGEIAKIIAAKNGFNLTERQAVYYMYENDISYGLSSKELSFESYGVEQAVKREQIPAFFQRLSEKGHTTFNGKPSNVTGDQLGGLSGVKPEDWVPSEKDFKDLEREKLGGEVELTGKIGPGDFSGGKSVAAKNGGEFDGSGSNGFAIKVEGEGTKIRYTQGKGKRFDISMRDVPNNKNYLIDTLKLTGLFTDQEIDKVLDIILVEDPKEPGVRWYDVSEDIAIEPSGYLLQNAGPTGYIKFAFRQ